MKKPPKCPTYPSIPPLSRTRRPGDGFYDYVNHGWLTKTHLDSWRSEFSVSDEIEEKTDKQLLQLLHAYRNGDDPPASPSSAEDHLRWVSRLWYNRSWEHEEIFLKIWLDQILSSTTRQQQANLLGQFLRFRISTFISIEIQEEIKSPFAVRSSFVAGNLTLPNGYYSTGASPVLDAYESMIQQFALEYGIPAVIRGIDAEAALATIYNGGWEFNVKDVKGANLKKLCPEFDWEAFMAGWGIDSEWRQRIWLLDSCSQISALLKWFSSAPLEEVAGLLSLHFLTFCSPYLRPIIREKSNILFQKALRGVSTELSEDLQFLSDVKSVLPDALCIVYSEKQHDHEVVTHTRMLVEHIRQAAIDIMRKTKIFTPKTASKVIEKLHRMYFVIGSGQSDNLPKVTYHNDSIIRNCLAIFEARGIQMNERIGRPSFYDHKNSYPCYVTNASYFSESNHIVMPWGILQWPFYCKDAPPGWNYGGIGATIAHEITHAFDMEGRFYNEKAVFKQWWTRKNRDKFEKRTRKVSKYFDQFKHFGFSVDGKRTLSENWADLGGVTIALEALRRNLGEGCPEERLKEAYRNFFLSYAVSWRTLMRKEKMVYAIKVSVHAPSEDRVDGIVPHFQEWVDAFNIQEGDPLYLEKSQRLKFF